MKTSANGIALIKHYEGLRLNTYLCAAGKKTIGYGHVILPVENYTTITAEKAEQILVSDLRKFEAAINRYVPNCKQHEFDALVSLVFNIGERNFADSTMLRHIRGGNMTLATGQFGCWIFANKIPFTGLIKRRAAEAILFSTGAVDLI